MEKACTFYEHELGLEPSPTSNLDFPAQFFKINEEQQLHVTEWEDQASFRGHLCLQVDAFDSIFFPDARAGRDRHLTLGQGASAARRRDADVHP